MLSAFPFFLSYWTYVPTFLRVVAGFYFFFFGYYGLNRDRWEKINIFEKIGLRPAKYFAYSVCIIEIGGAILLVAGLFVQVVSIIFAVILATALAIKIHGGNELRRDINTYFLLLVIMISLFILGPGRIAIDLMV